MQKNVINGIRKEKREGKKKQPKEEFTIVNKINTI